MDPQASKSTENKAALQELDQAFVLVFLDLVTELKGYAAETVQEVVSFSSKYISGPAHESLTKFHQLYFGEDETVKAAKEEINKDVDDIFDTVQQEIAAGKSEDEIKATVDARTSEDEQKKRLAMSGMQKQLEGLTTLDQGLRQEIAPALTAMQFEDLLRQRLEHLEFGWQEINTHLQERPTQGLEQSARAIAEELTSPEEISSYYELVLKEEAPKSIEDDLIFF